MTSWPWMKGIDVALADPIDPLDAHDDRPSVKALIQEHREKIDKIARALQDDPLYEPNTKHDDLWILRFWLSHKTSKKTIAAAKHALQFRKDYHLDEMDLRHMPPHKLTKEDSPTSNKIAHAEYLYFSKCKPDALLFTHPEDRRGVIGFFQFSSIDQHRVVKELEEDIWIPAYTYSNEFTFQWLDYETRTTGRLTKTIRLVDMTGMSFASLNRESSRRDGKAMEYMEDYYPQLLETLFVCNPPKWIHVAWKIFRPLLPKRVVTKIDFITPATNETERKRLYRHISQEKLPSKYGGLNQVPPLEW